MAVFSLDGGITREPYSQQKTVKLESSMWHNPEHPFTIAANVIWLIFFGWGFALLHLFAAIIQALTIVGIGTALTQLKLLSYIVWPLGRDIRKKRLPTTLEELYHSEDVTVEYMQRLEAGEEHMGRTRVY